MNGHEARQQYQQEQSVVYQEFEGRSAWSLESEERSARLSLKADERTMLEGRKD